MRVDTFLAIAAGGGLALSVVWELSGDGSPLTGTAPWVHLRHAHAFSYEDMPDLTNKTAVVTGASSGLGLAVAKGLADAGATVVATARSFEKCAATTKAIGSCTCVALELMSLRSVHRAARVVRELAPRVDYLVLNAGIMMPPLTLSEDGLEAQFQTNHLGHFLLVTELLPSLRRGARVRRFDAVAGVRHAQAQDAQHHAPDRRDAQRRAGRDDNVFQLDVALALDD